MFFSDLPIVGPLRISPQAFLGVPSALRHGREFASGLPERLGRRVEFLVLAPSRVEYASSVATPVALAIIAISLARSCD